MTKKKGYMVAIDAQLLPALKKLHRRYVSRLKCELAPEEILSAIIEETLRNVKNEEGEKQ